MAFEATVRVAFGEGPTRIVMETEPGAFASNDLPIRIYPANPDIVRATIGTVTYSMTRQRTVTGEGLLYQSASSAQVDYPGAGGVVVSDIGALVDGEGNLLTSSEFAYNANVDAVLSQDTDGNRVSVTGGVSVNYTAPYSRYLYSPLVEIDQGIYPGQTVSYGSVIAIKNGVAGKLTFSAELGNRRNYSELYRVYSEVVVDPDGRWEKPPNFPDNNNYPNSGAEGPNTGSYVVDQRVHEYGFLYRDGFWRRVEPHIVIENPFQALGNSYTPVYIYQEGSAKPGYEDAFRAVQWAPIYSELTSRYGLSF